MKPSWDEQRRNEPRTDRKFRAEDEHLVAENKEEVSKINQGDKLEALERHNKNNSRNGKTKSPGHEDLLGE